MSIWSFADAAKSEEPSNSYKLPSFDALFPPPPSFFSGKGSELLKLVVDNKFSDVLQKRLTELEKRQKRHYRHTYETSRDYAVALASATRLREAHHALAEARRHAANDPVKRRELALLQSLFELREGRHSAALDTLGQACAGGGDHQLATACMHLRAQYLGAAGRGPQARQTVADLKRRGFSIDFPFRAIPTTPAFDAVRTAHFDLFRKSHGPLWSDRADIDRARNVGGSYLIRFMRLVTSKDPTNQETYDALKMLTDTLFLRGSFAQAGLWPAVYVVAVKGRLARDGKEADADVAQRLNDAKILLAKAELRGGHPAEARRLLSEVREELEAVDDTPTSRGFALASLGQDFIVPEDPSVAIALFRDVFNANEVAATGDTQARSLAFNTGLRLIDLYLRAGDLRAFDAMRAKVSKLAALSELGPFPDFDRTRLHRAHVAVATAQAILEHAPTLDRLVEAEHLIQEVFSQVEAHVRLFDVVPDKIIEAYRSAFEDGGIAEGEGAALRGNAAMIQAKAIPVLARIYLRQERWKEAAIHLQQSVMLDMGRRSVCEDEDQAILNLDLAEAQSRAGDRPNSETAISETLLCLSAINTQSRNLPRALWFRAGELAAQGDPYTAELALVRAVQIRQSERRAGDLELAGYYDALTQLALTQELRDDALGLASRALDIVFTAPRQAWRSRELATIERTMSLLIENGGLALGQQPFEKLFELAQRWSASQAGNAVEAFARRTQVRDPRAALLIQRRGELMRQRAELDQSFLSLLGDAAAADNTERREKVLKEIAEADALFAQLGDAMAGTLKESDLIDPIPVPLAKIAGPNGVLRSNELLLTIVVGTHETFVLAVGAGATERRAYRVDLGAQAVEEAVTALRCGLDSASWIDGPIRTRCIAALGRQVSERATLLPFDAARSHALYRQLLGPIIADIQGKDLLVVLSGQLSALPLHVLVTEPPTEAFPFTSGARGDVSSYHKVAWLARRHAITVVPSASSLVALRQSSKAEQAPDPYVGWGNPILQGSGKKPCPASTGRAFLGCYSALDPRTGDAGFVSRGARTPETGLSRLYERGQVIRGRLEELCPLPETRYELECVQQTLSGSQDALFVSSRMTEANIKSTDLSRYRVVHFATHGLLASEAASFRKENPEPALVMTLPSVSTDEDDGLLTASEISNLKLNAALVILSACNTAAGGQAANEALSGLARAFFYAGARSLLVSHWYVASEAAVGLVAAMFTQMKAQPNLTHAEAARAAMLTFADVEGSIVNHPRIWAPFIVVGSALP